MKACCRPIYSAELAVGGVRHPVVDSHTPGGLCTGQQVRQDAQVLRTLRSRAAPLPVTGVRRPRRPGSGDACTTLSQADTTRRTGPCLDRHAHCHRR